MNGGNKAIGICISPTKLLSLYCIACTFLKYIFYIQNPIVPTEPVFGSLPFSKLVLQVFIAGWNEFKSRCLW